MGKQSARLYFEGRDHKDIYFQGNYHNAMYLDNKLLWRKLLNKYCYLYSPLWIVDAEKADQIKSDYTIISLKTTLSLSIAEIKDSDDNRFLAISLDELRWKRIKEISITAEMNYFISSSGSGFFIYISYPKDGLYYLDSDLLLNYTVSKIADCFSGYFNSWNCFGTSDYFYAITVNNSLEWTLHRVSQKGEVLSKEFKDNDILSKNYDRPEGRLIVVNERVFFITYQSSTARYLYYVKDMDTDYIYTALRIGFDDKFFENTGCINVCYDNYQVVLEVTNKPNLNPATYERTIKYSKVKYFSINAMGAVGLLKQIEGLEDLTIPLYNYRFRDDITIRFDEISGDDFFNGYIQCSSLGSQYAFFYKELSGGDLTSCLIEKGNKNKQCIIKTYYIAGLDGYVVIYIDNLFWNQSEGNFAFFVEFDS